MLACPVLAAMASHRRAWISGAELKLCGHDAGRLEALEADGLVERWKLPTKDLWCLTPLAAERLGVVMDERWECQREDPRPRAEQKRRPADPPYPRWIETPYWTTPEFRSESVSIPGRHGSYHLAELAEDHRTPEPTKPAGREPERAIDPVSGEPLVLFGGVPVWREHRTLLRAIADPRTRAAVRKALGRDPERPVRHPRREKPTRTVDNKKKRH